MVRPRQLAFWLHVGPLAAFRPPSLLPGGIRDHRRCQLQQESAEQLTRAVQAVKAGQ